MEAALHSFLAGIPFLLTHFAVSIAMLVAGVLVYMWITPHDEMALILGGNTAAAMSLAGAIMGLAIPLSICMANSASIWDIVIWGLVTLVLQLATFKVIDLWLRDLSKRIEDGEIGTAILLVSIRLAVALINGAAVS